MKKRVKRTAQPVDFGSDNNEFITDLRVFIVTSKEVKESDIVTCIVSALTKLEPSSETVISPASQSLK